MLRTAFASLLALAATASAQGVTAAIAPPGGSPDGCYANYQGSFGISPVNVTTTSKRSIDERAAPLGITLVNGILTDPQGRIGYIASNSQFQFDGPPQAGAIYTAGWSVCANGSLAIGQDVTFYKCLSGSFYNLYLDNDAGQCIESYLIATPLEAGGGPISGSATPYPSASVASNATVVTTSTRLNTSMIMSSSSSSGAAGGATTATTTGGGKTTGKTTKAPQSTTTGGGSGGSAASSSSSSTGIAAAMGPVGDVVGIFAGLLAFAMI